jgi:hypothetical protein
MIYTYGLTKTYTEILKKKKNVKKIGLRKKYKFPDGKIKHYLGGAVWKTSKDVQDYLLSQNLSSDEWSVYELDGNWNADTYHVDGENFNRLRNDCRIVKKII